MVVALAEDAQAAKENQLLTGMPVVVSAATICALV